jgi:hypothetical protein
MNFDGVLQMPLLNDTTPGDHRQHSSEARWLSRSRSVGRGQSPGRREIPGRVSWRLVNDGVEAQMGMLEPEIVPIEPVLWPAVMMPDGRTLCERIPGI